MSRVERDGRDAWVRSAVDRFLEPLVAYARGLLGDLHAAEDVVQEAFLRLSNQDPAALDGRLKPWLYRVCRNAATDVLRRRRIMPRTNATAHEGEAPAAPPDVATERREVAGNVVEALEALPEAQREATVLKLRHAMSYREIGEVMGATVSHVGVLIHEAMKTLRTRLVRAEGGAR